jgi:hypothetical protein
MDQEQLHLCADLRHLDEDSYAFIMVAEQTGRYPTIPAPA